MFVLDILDEVGQTSSGLEKIAILEKHKNCLTLETVCRLAYDPTVIFYTTYDVASETESRLTLDEALTGLLENVASRKYTGNAARDYVGELLGSLRQEDAEVLRRVIKRDLRSGFSASTINKVWEGLIPTFGFLLADTDPSRIVYPAISQLKADGMRAALFVDGLKGTVALMSRNGKAIDLLGQLDRVALLVARYGKVTLDGELVCMKDGVPLDRKTSNGILNKAIKGTITEEEASLVHFLAWDIVDESSTQPYSIRFATVNRMVEGIESEFAPEDRKIQVLESAIVETYEAALEHFKALRRQGHEGTIVKNMNGKWIPKRSKDLCKFKAEVEGEFRVTGFEYGTGKNADKVGNLLIESEDGKVKCSVGIFKDFEESVRVTWLTDTPKIVTVMYNERITDKSRKDGTESLFLPRVTAVRHDKDVANTRDELIEIENALLN